MNEQLKYSQTEHYYAYMPIYSIPYKPKKVVTHQTLQVIQEAIITTTVNNTYKPYTRVTQGSSYYVHKYEL